MGKKRVEQTSLSPSQLRDLMLTEVKGLSEHHTQQLSEGTETQTKSPLHIYHVPSALAIFNDLVCKCFLFIKPISTIKQQMRKELQEGKSIMIS